MANVGRAVSSIASFLKQRAVDVVVGGSYILPRWFDPAGKPRKFACRSTRVSPFRMIVEVPVVGKVGERLTSYFRDFGELDATISDVISGGFLMELEMTRARRAWMAEKLTWLEKRQKDRSIQDQRADTRFIPQVSHTTLTLADGTVHPCFVIDVSSSGAAVSAEYEPSIGTPLAVGNCVGRVVRHFQHGFAVRFVEKQNREQILSLIVRGGQTTECRASLTTMGSTVSI